MKINIKRCLLVVCAMFATLGISAANTARTIYIYGFAASFNDSTVYFTELQRVDSAYIDSKTKFLYGRENYSYQLQDYLDQKGWKHAVCITSYGLTKKEAEKKYLNLRKKYVDKGKFDIKYLKSSDSTYQAIKPEDN